MEIRDPIHGNIELNGIESKMVDAKPMQRLRYIKQLDVAYLVFPGAQHSRFEHSLGTMQVTKELVSATYGKGKEEYSYVGLLHDIGHGPFSHLSEPFIKKHSGKDHERLGEDRIRNSEIKDIISDSGLSLNRILRYFKESYKIDVVGGTIGSDRIDYLMRDSHYTGVAYGIIDYARIKSRIILWRNRIAISESGISGAESMLIARYFMHLNVYKHHTKLIASHMLQDAIGLALENGDFDARQLADMRDEELMTELSESTSREAAALTRRVLERNLFKRAYYSAVNGGINTEEISDAIMRAGFDREDFVMEVVSLGGGSNSMDVVGSDGNLVGKLAEVSPLIKRLNEILTNSQQLLVGCDRKNVGKLESIVRRFLK